jgi:hypothetical protein
MIHDQQLRRTFDQIKQGFHLALEGRFDRFLAYAVILCP